MAPFLAALHELPAAVAPLKEITRALAEGLGRPLMPLLLQVPRHRADVRHVGLAESRGHPHGLQDRGSHARYRYGGTVRGRNAARGLRDYQAHGGGVGIMATLFKFLLSPVGLVVLAIAGLAAAWLAFTASGQNTRAKFSEIMGDMRNDIKSVADALMSGRIQLAWDIVLLSMKIAWTKFYNFISEGWRNFALDVVETNMSILDKLFSPEYIKNLKETIRDMRKAGTADEEDELNALLARMAKLKAEVAKGGIKPLEFQEKKTPVLSDPASLLRGAQASLGLYGKEDAVPVLKRSEVLLKRQMEYLKKIAEKKAAFVA